MLEGEGLAPKLFHTGEVGQFIVVVMAEVTNAINIEDYLRNNVLEQQDVLQQCRTALHVLHEEGFVHGDFRPCNF